MQVFTKHTGLCVPVFEQNIDTDQILPKQFLLRIERTGFDEALFYDWRFDKDGNPKPGFPLNQPHYEGCSILLTGPNFGCGSSREHAPWGLSQYGFRVIIAPSFADIFQNNCIKTGLLPVVLDEDQVTELVAKTGQGKGYKLTVDLEKQTVSDGMDFSANFVIDEFSRYCLLNGLDDIGLTLQHENLISEFESRSAAF